MKKPQKLFVIKKYVFATNAKDAIRKEKRVPVDDVWIDEKWRDLSITQKDTPMGFS